MHRLITGFLVAFALFGAGQAAFGADAPADPRLADRVMGDPKAPVRIDEYASLSCPHCAGFDTETLPQIKADYIDKGKVKLIFHEFPLNDIARVASMLARCAPPDHYFAMVDTLFRTQRGWVLDTAGASLAALKQQAKFGGLSDSQIDACLADHKLEEGLLKQQLDDEKTVKINSTPTFTFNGDTSIRIEGALPYDSFKDKINSLLKK